MRNQTSELHQTPPEMRRALRKEKQIFVIFSPWSQLHTNTRAGFHFKPELSLSRRGPNLAHKTRNMKSCIRAAIVPVCLSTATRHPAPGQPIDPSSQVTINLISTSSPQTTYLLPWHSSLYESLITMTFFVFALNRCPDSITLILPLYLLGLLPSCGCIFPFPSEFYSLH